MTNYEKLIKWLNETTAESTKKDLQMIERVVSSPQSLIMYTISMTPVDLALELTAKLDALCAFATSDETSRIDNLRAKLAIYVPQLKALLPEAQQKAEEVLESYNEVEARKAYDFMAIFNPSAAILCTPDWKKTLVNTHSNDSNANETQEEPEPFKIRKGGFYSETSACQSFYTRASQSYMKHWARLLPRLEDIQSVIEKYPDNQFGRILQQGKASIIEAIDTGEFNFFNELGHLLLGRILHEAPSWTSKEKAKVFNINKITMGEATFDEEEFKFEIIKIHLFAALAKGQQQKPVAWIGSSRSVLARVKQNPGEGAYLNCDDAKWSSSLNRAWLVALLMLDYQIQIVEPQFPKMEKAILSGDFVKYVECLVSEMRKYDGSSLEASRKNDSMYHGGIEPTATMQELLLLLSMDCKTFKDEEGYLRILPPVTQEEIILTSAYDNQPPAAPVPGKSEEGDTVIDTSKSCGLRITHSYAEHGRSAKNSVPACTFFNHPGVSSEQRSAFWDDSKLQGDDVKDMESNMALKLTSVPSHEEDDDTAYDAGNRYSS